MFSSDLFSEARNKAQSLLNQHIEEFACAFAKKTGLPPDKIVMIVEDTYPPYSEETGIKYTRKIWFEERK